MIPVFVGFDQREAAVLPVLTQSILDTASVPVSITPLHGPMLDGFDGQQDGTNAFTYARFLVPELMGFKGWALYMDSDMLFRKDIADLWALRDFTKAVMVCQHEYKTKNRHKFVGSPLEAANEHYPRKNWSSLILWNCGHPAHRLLRRGFVAEAGGKFLHRFTWLNDDQIGSLPLEWNWLVGELPFNPDAKLIHTTLGAPGFDHYSDCHYSAEWHTSLLRAVNMAGEDPAEMVERAQEKAA